MQFAMAFRARPGNTAYMDDPLSVLSAVKTLECCEQHLHLLPDQLSYSSALHAARALIGMCAERSLIRERNSDFAAALDDADSCIHRALVLLEL